MNSLHYDKGQGIQVKLWQGEKKEIKQRTSQPDPIVQKIVMNYCTVLLLKTVFFFWSFDNGTYLLVIAGQRLELNNISITYSHLPPVQTLSNVVMCVHLFGCEMQRMLPTSFISWGKSTVLCISENQCTCFSCTLN